MIEMPERPRLNLYTLLKICDDCANNALDELGDPDYTYETSIIERALKSLIVASDCSQKLRTIQMEYESNIIDIMRKVRDIAYEIESLNMDDAGDVDDEVSDVDDEVSEIGYNPYTGSYEEDL